MTSNRNSAILEASILGVRPMKNLKMKADLHMHSRISDGSDDIEQLILHCQEAGLTHIAVTDHDTFESWDAVNEGCQKAGIRAIKSSEISCRDPETKKKAHILAYDMKDTKNLENLTRITLEQRHQCSLETVKQLQKAGYDISEESIRPYYKKILYKQQIMDYLVKRGYTDKIYGALYQSLFYSPGEFRFSHPYPDPAFVVETIVEGGGKAVLAHPGQQQNFELLPKLKEAGLWGIELNHQSNSLQDQDRILREGKERHLFFTGGSDYHGYYAPTFVAVGEYPCPWEAVMLLFEKK